MHGSSLSSKTTKAFPQFYTQMNFYFSTSSTLLLPSNMSFVSLFVVFIMMFATVGTPPPMAQAQSFTIHTRLTNASRHKLRQKLLYQSARTRLLHLDQGTVFPPMPSGLVYVSAHFGTPPLVINLALDTLFPFTWVQTVGCRRHCFNLSYPYSNFDPRNSTTFRLLSPNDTTICSPPISHPSRNGSSCVYDGGYSRGIFGIDEFQLLSPHSSSLSRNRIVFGCDLDSMMDFNGGWDFNPIGGMIGLGKGHPSSIVSQLGSDRFSYCLPSLSHSQSGQPTLNFGLEAFIATATNVQTTPISSRVSAGPPEEFYNYLNITAITLNGEVVYMMPETSSLAKLVLLDTGEPETWLVEDAIFSLQDGIVRYFAENYGWNEPKIEPISRMYACCYDLPTNLSSIVFPKIAMQFVGGAILELQNAFEIFPDENEFCMVIGEGAPNTLGVYQQMGYRFVFDLAQSKLSFAPNMC